MAIRITNAVDEYDHVFMREILISQSVRSSSAEAPLYLVSLAWKYYKIDEETGAITFKEGSESFYSVDLGAEALSEYLDGNSAKMSALMANQSAVATIVQAETGLALEAY
jgi:hypothetical protein